MACLSAGSFSECSQKGNQPNPAIQEVFNGVHYGFNNQYSGLFSQIQEEVWHLLPSMYELCLSVHLQHSLLPKVSEIVQLPFPDTTPAADRRELRELAEDAKFDPEHYMCAPELPLPRIGRK